MKLQFIIIVLVLISCGQLNTATKLEGKELWQKFEILLKENGTTARIHEYFGPPNEMITKNNSNYWFYYKKNTTEQKYAFNLGAENVLTSFVYIPKGDSYPEFELDKILEYLKNDKCIETSTQIEQVKGHVISVERKISCREQTIVLKLNKYNEIEFINFNLKQY